MEQIQGSENRATANNTKCKYRKASYWKPDTLGNGAKVGLLGSQFLY